MNNKYNASDNIKEWTLVMMLCYAKRKKKAKTFLQWKLKNIKVV